MNEPCCDCCEDMCCKAHDGIPAPADVVTPVDIAIVIHTPWYKSWAMSAEFVWADFRYWLGRKIAGMDQFTCCDEDDE